MSTCAQHLLVEFTQCDVAILNDINKIETLMRAAAEIAQTTIINALFQQFQPQGVTGILLLSESHLSIHTWPEQAYASVDFYTCGQGLPEAACAYLQQGLQAKHVEKMLVERGLISNTSAMQIRYHQ